MKLCPYLTPYTKINSKWIKDINVRCKTIKLLEENIRQNFHNIGFGNDLLGMTPQTKATKEKIYKWDIMKFKNFLCIKKHYQQSKKEIQRTGENIYKSCT